MQHSTKHHPANHRANRLERADLTRRLHIRATGLRQRLSEPDERGEGVISMAIAVLIVAFLGAAAWLAFKGLLDGTKEKAETQIARVGG
ncbi:MAG: hypothetical protein ACKV2O_17795 [Acidimicrobiales bacterium]